MAYAEAARAAGEAAVGDERHGLAHALAVERCGGGEHFAHARAAARAFIANHYNIARLVFAFFHRLERGFFGIEAARGAGESQVLHARDFYNRSLRREI